MSIKVLGSVIVTMLLLQGCGDTEQSVEWYQAHAAERKERIKWCANDAARGITADCMNAAKAEQLENVTNGKRTFDRNYKFK